MSNHVLYCMSLLILVVLTEQNNIIQLKVNVQDIIVKR